MSKIKLENEFNYYLNKVDKNNLFFGEKNRKELDLNGFTIIRTNKDFWVNNHIDIEKIDTETDKLINDEGLSGGWEGVSNKNKKIHAEKSAQRISNLPNKNNLFLKLSLLPDFLVAANHVIKRPFKFNAMQIRNPLPYSDKQPLHIDFRPRLAEYFCYPQITCFVYLDKTTKDNGALQVYPGTHKWLGNPDIKKVNEKNMEPINVEVDKYDIVIINVHVWHHGGKNVNGQRRRTIFTSFRERSEWQQLNQKKFLSHEVKKVMSDIEKYFYAIREKDKERNEFFYNLRNIYLFKKFLNLRDRIYNRFY